MTQIDILISAVLALIMFGIGASLKPADFRNVFLYPKALLLGLSLQMIFLPLFFFGIIEFSNLSNSFKIGLFIIALCPGGTTSNFISYIVKAEVALSISLTIINSVLILFTIPALTSWILAYYLGDTEQISLPVGRTILNVFALTLLPALLGVLFNTLFEKLSVKLKQPLKYINVSLLAIVFGIKFLAGEDQGGSGMTWAETLQIFPYALVAHLGSMLISYFVAKWSGIANRQSTTIGIEVGLQNTTLSLLVTGTLIGINEMTKPSLVFVGFSFFTTLLFAWLAMRTVKLKKVKA